MQDTDGGVFHKLTTKAFANAIMPEKHVKQRYVIGKTVTATWDFTAVTSVAADLYKKYDAEFAEKCAKAARRAHDWAMMHPFAFYEQPKDVGTGEYGDGNAVDEQIWGAAELYRISRDSLVLKNFKQYAINSKRHSLQSWASSYALAAFTIATNPKVFDEATVDSAKALIFDLADSYLDADNGYGIALGTKDFIWGSNANAANKSMVLLHAYILSKEKKYMEAAISIVDYLLGRNPLDISYMTGYGVNTPKNPHHRISYADGIEEPIPGMLVGGPNPKDADPSAKKEFKKKEEELGRSLAAAESYADVFGSYATNEVAINWNAPFAYVIGTIQAITATGKSFDIDSYTPNTYELTPISKAAPIAATPAVGFRKVVRDNKIQIERTTKTGEKLFFNLKGKRIK